MPSLLASIASLLLLVPLQGPSQEDLLDTVKELEIENAYIRAQAEEKIRALGSKLIPLLRAELQMSDVRRKRRAAKAASLIGVKAEPLVDLLAEQISNNDLDLRGNALAALGQIGAPARRALVAIDKLKPPLDPETSRLVMIVRSRLMEDPSQLWDSFVEASRSSDPRMRFAGLTLAFEKCRGREDLVVRFLSLSRDPNPDVRKQTQKLMASLGAKGRDQVDAIARGKNPLQSVQAMMLLGHFDMTQEQLTFLLAELELQPKNQAAREALLVAATRTYPLVLERFQALVELKAQPEVLDRFLFYFQGLGRKSVGLGRALAPVLDRSERNLRLHVLETLRDTGYEDSTAERAIMAQLTPGDRAISKMAIAALGSSRRPSTEMLQFLVDLLGRSKNSTIRRSAMQALGILGERCQPVFGALAKVLEGEDVEGAQLAAVAFGELGPKAVAWLIARYPEVKGTRQRMQVLRAFGEFGLGARPALPLLQEQLSSAAPDLRTACLVALARMGDAGRVAIPQVLSILADDKASLEERMAACTALSLLGVGDPRLIEPLIETSKSSDEDLAGLSILALGELNDVAVLPRLLEALEDPNAQFRWRAAFAIGRLGRDAAEALPALKAHLGDADPAVRMEAERAMQAIGGR